MSEALVGDNSYCAEIRWSRGDQVFTDNRYSRAHEWAFDGGVVVPASASPHIVREPMSVAANVDPEEAFVASLASCHMLFFLSLALERGLVIDSYIDAASGTLGRNASGQLMMTRVCLRPAASYSPDQPAPALALLESIHEDAHQRCFIANSVTTEVAIEILS